MMLNRLQLALALKTEHALFPPEDDIASATWEILATPAHIEGRGGAGFSATPDGKSLLVCGGFAGREMNDVHAYSIATGSWTTRFPATGLSLRPRSVWPVRPLPGTGFVVGFGGEVNPSGVRFLHISCPHCSAASTNACPAPSLRC